MKMLILAMIVASGYVMGAAAAYNSIAWTIVGAVLVTAYSWLFADMFGDGLR